MNSLTATLLFLFSFLPVSALADQGWNHRNLMSREGVRIDVDYQYSPRCLRFTEGGRSDNEIRLADPVWINVSGAGVNGRVEVEVEFWRQSYRRFGGGTPQLQRVHNYYDRIQPLSPAGGGRYTGSVGSLAIRHSIGSAYESWKIGQKIRVKVNGYALIDPISGTDQFLIFLDDERACSYF